MKKVFIIVVLSLIGFGLHSQDIKPQNESQGPLWRAITPTVRTGVGEWKFIQPSINTFYQLNNKLAITSWIGGQYSTQNNSRGWTSGDLLINKLWSQGKTRVGMGVQYGLGTPFTQLSNIKEQQSVFFIVEFSHRFKLR